MGAAEGQKLNAGKNALMVKVVHSLLELVAKFGALSYRSLVVQVSCYRCCMWSLAIAKTKAGEAKLAPRSSRRGAPRGATCITLN